MVFRFLLLSPKNSLICTLLGHSSCFAQWGTGDGILIDCFGSSFPSRAKLLAEWSWGEFCHWLQRNQYFPFRLLTSSGYSGQYAPFQRLYIMRSLSRLPSCNNLKPSCTCKHLLTAAPQVALAASPWSKEESTASFQETLWLLSFLSTVEMQDDCS